MDLERWRDEKQQLCWEKIKSDKLVGKTGCKVTRGGPFSMKSLGENQVRASFLPC